MKNKISLLGIGLGLIAGCACGIACRRLDFLAGHLELPLAWYWARLERGPQAFRRYA